MDLPKELFLECAWKVSVTELLCTYTFYESPTLLDDRTWTVSNDARLDGSTHFIMIAEEQYPGYNDVFEHVFEAMAASLTKGTSHVQETFTNVLEQQRTKQTEIALKVNAKREILFHSGSVVVTLKFRNRRN